ncbi:MAG: hypothetical protein JSS53_06750, partial [Proteobacteria bacterium]|nr:hypothetical protein [Pseudomonadota bacterium]
NSLDKAAFIERIESSEMRKKLIEMCINGASLNELKVCLSSIKKTFDVDREKKLKPGRISKRVNLGFTNKVGVIKRIVEAFLAHHEEDDYQKIFSSTDWSSYSSVTQVFRRFIQKLEQE